MKSFFVFKCPKCGNFTNAPAGQKRRRCSYCGTIIDISKAACAIFDSPEMASTAVKEFNAIQGGDEFQKAVERSRERVRALMPEDTIRTSDISDGELISPPGKQKRLMALLEKEAKKSPCSLDRIEEMCIEHELDWKWVESQLEKLSNNGTLIFPRPWSVQLVTTKEKDSESNSAISDVSIEILALLSESNQAANVIDIVKRFEERGISETSVMSSLEKLMQRGEIYEPRSGKVQLV
ncbi:MAG: hypothetical protein ACFFE3_14360 [Candidatus Thorarchaeota archaeon]